MLFEDEMTQTGEAAPEVEAEEPTEEVAEEPATAEEPTEEAAA